MKTPALTILSLLLVLTASAQQVPDDSPIPAPKRSAHPTGRGPLVLVDQAHDNFHRLDARFGPFGRLVRADGCRTEALEGPVTTAALRRADLFVIANAASPTTDSPDSRPFLAVPAFTSEEIAALDRWIRDGGSLLLIADHAPFPPAVATLARRFGVVFLNGYLLDRVRGSGDLTFRHSDQSLGSHPVTKGGGRFERVDEVRSFTGSAFRALPGVALTPLFRLHRDHVVLLPAAGESLGPDTAWVSAEGLVQAGLLRHGRGRVAVFGEAAMFTAQLAGPQRRPVGLTDPTAKDNPAFVRNVVRWLAPRARRPHSRALDTDAVP
ncbi:MAG: hypothetical protein AAF533_03610 [Acidobacteriota bacterium]